MKNLKTCLIGYGHLGKHHARILRELEGSEMVGVCDVNPESRAAAKEKNFTVFDQHRDMLGRVDAAVIATPTEHHYEVALDFIEAGTGLLIEKPLASNIEQAEELVRAAREKNVTLFVGHIERFNPVIMAAEKEINTPRFIQADRVSPFSFRSVDIGVVMDMMIHDIDLVLHLAKSRVKEVFALGVPVLGTSEDIANARLVFENGCTANVTASRVAIKTERKIRLFQDDAYLTMDLAKREARLFRKTPECTPEVVAKVNSGEIENPLEFMLDNYIEIREFDIPDADQLTVELGYFLDAVRTGDKPMVTGEDGAEAIRVARMIIESLENPPWADISNSG